MQFTYHQFESVPRPLWTILFHVARYTRKHFPGFSWSLWRAL